MYVLPVDKVSVCSSPVAMFVPEGSDVFHESEPQEDDGDGEQTQTDSVETDGRSDHVSQVDTE